MSETETETEVNDTIPAMKRDIIQSKEDFEEKQEKGNEEEEMADLADRDEITKERILKEFAEEIEQDRVEHEIDDYKLPDEVQQRLSSAIKDIETNQSLSSRFRAELEQYITIMDEKTSSVDGGKLIKVPKNFQTIVNAMTREDLFDQEDQQENNSHYQQHQQQAQAKSSKENGKDDNKSSNKPLLPSNTSTQPLTGLSAKLQDYQQMKKLNKQSWYRYLMEDYVNRDMNHEYKGRYSNILLPASSEEKVKKGLAEILLLDRELYQLSKTAEMALTDSTPRYEGMNSSSSALQTPKSTSSRHGFDRTFITKTNSNTGNATTPRSVQSSEEKRRKESKQMLKDAGGDLEENFDEDDERKDGLIGSSFGRPLTEEQNKRIDDLLQIDEGDLVNHFSYISSEDRRLDDEINQRLERYGRLPRLLELSGATKEVITVSEGKRKKIVTKIVTKDDGNDYLRQQRAERKEKEQEKKIESMLLQLTQNKEVDYRQFFQKDDACIHSRSYYNSSSLHEVPLTQDIKLDAPITREDINILVNNLKKNTISLLSSPSSLFAPSSVSRPTTAQSIPDVSSRIPDLTIINNALPFEEFSEDLMSDDRAVRMTLLAGKDEIRQLLSSLQTEVLRLQLYRNKHESIHPPSVPTSSLKEEDFEEVTVSSPSLLAGGSIIGKKKNGVAITQREGAVETDHIDRPFSASDFDMIPSYLKLNPRSAAISSPQRPNRLEGGQVSFDVHYENSIHQRIHLPPIKLTSLVAEERNESKSSSKSAQSVALESELVESSNPYSLNRRIKPPRTKQAIASANSVSQLQHAPADYHHDLRGGSPRAQRLYLQISSRAEASDLEASDLEAVEWGDLETPHQAGDIDSDINCDKTYRVDDDMEGEEEETVDFDQLNLEDKEVRKKLLVEKVRQFVEI